MNSVIITGRLTRDPEVKAVNDTHVTTIIVAVEKKSKGVSRVSYLPVVAWGALASAIGKYLTKGAQVAVKGELMQKVYKNTEGKTVSKIEISADSVEFLSPMNRKAEDHAEEADGTSDELPF